MTYIVIDINSDCDPITYPLDTGSDVDVARRALRDAGLAYEDVWVSPGDEYSPDAYKNGQRLFAAPRY